MTTITHYKSDDLIIEVPVTFEAGSGLTSLTGGQAEADATDGYTTVTGTAVIDDDTILVTFAEDVFPAGLFTLSVRATVGAVTQTVRQAQIVVHP